MNMNAEPVVAEMTTSRSPDVVWKAITEKEQMCQWFFDAIPEFAPEVGFQTEFNVRCEEQDYLHQWKVTEVDEGKKIAYQWRYGGLPGDSTVTWELSETPTGSKLRLTHATREPFPSDNPLFSRESGQAGWDYFICESLPAYLGG